MWIISKKVGVFTHYLTPTGIFQPSLERASKFPAREMAEAMAKTHGGVVQQLNQSE